MAEHHLEDFPKSDHSEDEKEQRNSLPFRHPSFEGNAAKSGSVGYAKSSEVSPPPLALNEGREGRNMADEEIPHRASPASCFTALQQAMRLNAEGMKVLEEKEGGVARSHQILLEALRVIQHCKGGREHDTSEDVDTATSSALPPSFESGDSAALRGWVPEIPENYQEAWLLALAMTLSNLGCQLRKANRPLEALSFLNKAKDVEASVHGKPSASTLLNISAVLLGLGELENALEIAKECVITTSAEDRVLHITALHNYAMALGQIPLAGMKEESQSRPLTPSLSDRHTIAGVYGYEGRKSNGAKEGKEALRMMQQALMESETYLGSAHPTTALLRHRCLQPEKWILPPPSVPLARNSLLQKKEEKAGGVVRMREPSMKSIPIPSGAVPCTMPSQGNIHAVEDGLVKAVDKEKTHFEGGKDAFPPENGKDEIGTVEPSGGRRRSSNRVLFFSQKELKTGDGFSTSFSPPAPLPSSHQDTEPSNLLPMNLTPPKMKKRKSSSTSSWREGGRTPLSQPEKSIDGTDVNRQRTEVEAGGTEPVGGDRSAEKKKSLSSTTSITISRGSLEQAKEVRGPSSNLAPRSASTSRRKSEKSNSAEGLSVTWKGKNKSKEKLRGPSQEPKISISEDLQLQARRALEALGPVPESYLAEPQPTRLPFPLPTLFPSSSSIPEGGRRIAGAGTMRTSLTLPMTLTEMKRTPSLATSLARLPSSPSFSSPPPPPFPPPSSSVVLPPLPLAEVAADLSGRQPSLHKVTHMVPPSPPPPPAPPLPWAIPTTTDLENSPSSFPCLDFTPKSTSPPPSCIPTPSISSKPAHLNSKANAVNLPETKSGSLASASFSSSSSHRVSGMGMAPTAVDGLPNPYSASNAISPVTGPMKVAEMPLDAFSPAVKEGCTNDSFQPHNNQNYLKSGPPSAGGNDHQLPPLPSAGDSDLPLQGSLPVGRSPLDEGGKKLSVGPSHEDIAEFGPRVPPGEASSDNCTTGGRAFREIHSQDPCALHFASGTDANKSLEGAIKADNHGEALLPDGRGIKEGRTAENFLPSEKLINEGEGRKRHEGKASNDQKEHIDEYQDNLPSFSSTSHSNASHSNTHFEIMEAQGIPRDEEVKNKKDGFPRNALACGNSKGGEEGKSSKAKNSFLRFAGGFEGNRFSSIGVQPFSSLTYQDLRRQIRHQAKSNDGRPSSTVSTAPLSASSSGPPSGRRTRRRTSVLAQALEVNSLNRTPFQKFHIPSKRQQRIEDQRKEEELYRIKRENEEVQKKKEKVFQAQLSIIRTRTENRAASCIQALWQYWWYSIGKPRKEAQRRRAEEREKLVHLRHIKDLTRKSASQEGEWNVPGLPPPAVVIRCGRKWLSQTTAVRYLARRRIPLRRRREVDIQRLLTRMQARVRGMLARARYSRTQTIHQELLLDLRPQEIREYAALLIQKMYRCHRARQLYSQAYLERYEPHAIKIQEWFRQLLFDHRARQVDTTTVNRRASAALMIQKTWRGYLGRVRAYMTKLRLAMNECRMKEQRGTRVLQRWGRGYLQRKCLGKEALDCCIRGIQARKDKEAEEEEASRQANVKVRFPEIVVPKNAYEASCLERADEVYRQQQKDREEYDVPLYYEPEAQRQQQEWIEAIRFLPCDVRRQRAEEDLHCALELLTLRRQRAAVKIQRAFRAWRNAKDCLHRNNAYLLICKGCYHQREYERVIQEKEYSRRQAKGVALYGDMAAPQRESVEAVRRELKKELDESWKYASSSKMRSRGERLEAEVQIQHSEGVVERNLLLQEQQKQLLKHRKEGVLQQPSILHVNKEAATHPKCFVRNHMEQLDLD